MVCAVERAECAEWQIGGHGSDAPAVAVLVRECGGCCMASIDRMSIDAYLKLVLVASCECVQMAHCARVSVAERSTVSALMWLDA